MRHGRTFLVGRSLWAVSTPLTRPACAGGGLRDVPGSGPRVDSDQAARSARPIPSLPRSRSDERHAHPQRHPQRGHRGPRRPRQDHARRRHAVAVRRLPREPGRERARHGLHGPRAREGHHDPGEEHGRAPRRREDQHRRHARPRRLRRRGRARAHDGGRRAAAGRRQRGSAAADPVRAPQGAGVAPAGDPRREQGRPPGRPRGRGRARGRGAVPGPRRRRAPDRFPDPVRERPGRPGGGTDPDDARGRPRAAVRDPAAPTSPRPSTRRATRSRRS